MCLEGAGGGGCTSTPNAKTIKGTHSYLMIWTFLVNLGGRVISDRERLRFVPLEKVSSSFCGKVVKNQSKTTTKFAPRVLRFRPRLNNRNF